MCTYSTEKVRISGSAKGASGWFKATEATVYFDHPVHAPLGHSLNVDLMNPEQGPEFRAAMELDAESARGLAEAILKMLDSTPDGLKDH
ncbi:MAG: hypothetical protein HKL82_08940 [Acidimicrobiaceae bacterium]|nr:hypothetical protein [Acidimicrobiaceae bacterium]